jgi:hypothetical protein
MPAVTRVGIVALRIAGSVAQARIPLANGSSDHMFMHHGHARNARSYRGQGVGSDRHGPGRHIRTVSAEAACA